jgi:hypothetical protein
VAPTSTKAAYRALSFGNRFCKGKSRLLELSEGSSLVFYRSANPATQLNSIVYGAAKTGIPPVAAEVRRAELLDNRTCDMVYFFL